MVSGAAPNAEPAQKQQEELDVPATATSAPPKPKKLSPTHKPKDLTLEQWQRELRRQYAGEQALDIRKLGRERVFSEFAVTNPATKRTYRVVIRGEEPGVNFCACPDYAVNTLGTCKHIEATLERLRRDHPAALRRSHTPPYAEVYVRYGTQRAVRFSPGADCPPALNALAARYFDPDGVVRPDAFARFNDFLVAAGKLGHDLRVYDDALAFIAEVRDGQARRAHLQKRYAGKERAAAWRNLLKVPLYPYQRTGALFAAQAGRALLADEMGLGKTIQAIAAAEILARECGLERVLIVCPTSLKAQWLHEIGQFSGRPALIIEGLIHQRKILYERNEAFFKIVNYDVVHRDLEPIGSWAPELIVLDEAQRIKNWQTRAARSVKQIPSRYALVLTGTPLENRLEELHSIVEFVDRHRLGPLFAFKAAHEVHEPGTSKVVGYRDLNRVTQTLAPILIRRSKQEVLSQLPPRMDKNFFVPMTDPQWTAHRENQEIVARLVAKWRRYKFLTESDQLRLRIALQTMRMACDSTYLVDHETRHGTKVGELGKLLDEVFERPDAKVVIFSQWVRMNELVAEMLADRRWGHVHLHGGVPGRERKDLVRALREDEDCRVFLSTDAGGVGLNLQRAATVINMDLPWNPAVLEQRIGRVHRLGQREPVRVVNFISEGTIEHGMLSLLAFKRSMFAGVLDGAADEVFMGDSALNRFMKTVETAATAAPRVVATPTEEEAREGEAPVAPAGPTKPVTMEAERATGVPATPDVQVFGELLARGAEFLQALGRSLGDPSRRADEGGRAGWQPLVETDPQTGRRELRLALPDDRTLQQWVGRFVSLLGLAQPRD